MFRIKAVSWIVIRVLNMLTLPVLCISESCTEVKTSIFIFTFLCGASKGFTKAFKASFEAPQSSVIFKLFLFVQAWRVKLQETTTTKSLGYWVHPSKNQWIQKNLSICQYLKNYYFDCLLPMFHFNTPWKHLKTVKFSLFRVTEMLHWEEMGLINFPNSNI